MARPTDVQRLITRINKENDIKVGVGADIMEQLNRDIPDLMNELVLFAKGEPTCTLKPSQVQAIKYLVEYHESLSKALDKAADRLRENTASASNLTIEPDSTPSYPTVSIQ